MVELQEIKCAKITEVDGVKYMVRKFGIDNVVFEEHLILIPENKIIRIFKEDGTEDISKQKTEKIK